MAKKSGNLLIKVAVLIALAAAVFFGLDSWRKQSTSEQATVPEATAPALSAEEAHRIGTEIGTRIGTEIGTRIGREVAAQMLAERAGETQVAATEPVEEVPAMPEPGPVAEPVSEPAATAEEAAPVAVDETAVTETAAIDDTDPFAAGTDTVDSGEAAAKPEKGPGHALGEGDIPGTPVAGSTASDTWWTKTITGEPGDLALTFAGNYTSIGGDVRGIALMFTGRFTSQTDFSSISVSGLDSPEWRLGVSPGLIYAPAPSGTYTVTVNSGLTDIDGKSLKTDASGPVNVE